MTREEQFNKLFIRLSGQFLSEHLPDNFFQLSEEDQMLTIEENAWEPLENHLPETVYDLIESLTYDVQQILDKGI
jgi:hypothetical protein